MKLKKQKNKNLFTMVELVIVVAIIALLSALVGPNVMQMFGDAQVSAAKSDMAAIKTAVVQYRVKNPSGGVPTMQDLVSSKCLEKSMKDPWGGDYSIEINDTLVIVSTKGKDGQNPLSTADEN